MVDGGLATESRFDAMSGLKPQHDSKLFCGASNQSPARSLGLHKPFVTIRQVSRVVSNGTFWPPVGWVANVPLMLNAAAAGSSQRLSGVEWEYLQ